MRVFGIVSGVRSERKSGVKVGDESASKYKDRRASMSVLCQSCTAIPGDSAIPSWSASRTS